MSQITKKSWEEFRAAGLLWWINRSLHLFGWSIVTEVDTTSGSEVVNVYPARVKYRGFMESDEDDGFKELTNYLGNILPELKQEANSGY